MNNNRDWFQPHKQQYLDYLYEPMKALGQELFQPFLDKPGTILKVSRIYRDARMHHPTPYKESLWLCIRQDSPWWAECPCLCFEICPDGIRYGLIWWSPRPAAMAAFREFYRQDPGQLTQLIRRTEAVSGTPVTARLYKRPRPDSLPELEPFWSWRDQIACIREEPVSPEIFGPELKDRVNLFLQQLVPLYGYLVRFPG